AAVRFSPKTMDTLNEPDGSGGTLDKDRVRTRLVAGEARPAHEITVGDAGRHEEQALALAQVVDQEHAIEVTEAHGLGPLGLLGVTRLQPAHEAAAQALERRGREDA